MSAIAKLMRIYRLPQDERRRHLRQRFRDVVLRTLFTGLGAVLNRPHSSFIVAARPDFDYDLRRFEDYPRLYGAWTAGMPRNGADVARLFLLYLNACQIRDDKIAGDLVELGVYKGNSAKVLREIMDADRTLYLFDTFSGFDERDIAGPDARANRESFRDTSLESVRAFVGTRGVVYVPGFFPASAKDVSLPAQIALAHIDCDLYDPMKAALAMFYPRMTAGGIMLLHDYGSGQWPGATKAVAEFFADKPEGVVVMPDKSGTAVVRIAKGPQAGVPRR